VQGLEEDGERVGGGRGVRGVREVVCVCVVCVGGRVERKVDPVVDIWDCGVGEG